MKIHIADPVKEDEILKKKVSPIGYDIIRDFTEMEDFILTYNGKFQCRFKNYEIYSLIDKYNKLIKED